MNKSISIGALFMVPVAALIAASANINRTIEEKTIHVVSKERLTIIKSSKDGVASTEFKNFVYSEDEAYTVDDNIWIAHFTSGTVYAQIKEGADCEVTLSGIRVGFLSMFQNIVKAECEVLE